MKKTDSLTKIIIGLIIIIIVILIYYFISNGNSTNSMKNKLITAAENYIKNNPNTRDEVYLSANQLNVKLSDNCSNLSGVFVRDNNYQAYLKCGDYEDKIVNNPNNLIKLNGEELLFLPKGINYVEKGYNSSSNIITSGEIMEDNGLYTLSYLAVNDNNQILERAERLVIVVDDNVEKNKYPILSLKGDATMYIDKGLEFTDPGITVMKNNTVDTTATIKTEGTIDTLKSGTQVLTYYVTNTEGYANSITRNVIVNDSGYDIVVNDSINPKEKTNENVIISLQIEGRSYSHTILPDNDESYEKLINYTVTENGSYEFKLFDINNNPVIKTIVVDNINKTKPVGICNVVMYNDSTQVNVTMSTDNKIEKYEYILNGNKETSNSNNYQTTISDINTASVSVIDEVNNTNTITCTIDDKRTAQIYTDNFGKPCIKGYVCYQQGKYRERFCSTVLKDGTPRCGPIGETGCSITSLATIISRYNKKSSNGTLHTPDTLVTEILNPKYPTNYGSGTTAIKNVLNDVGLSISYHYGLTKSNFQYVKACLKKGPVLIHATPGYYTTGKHYMALLAINDQEQVFLYDPARAGNRPSNRIDNWTTLELLKEGEVDNFWCVAESGVYHYEKEALARDLGLQ